MRLPPAAVLWRPLATPAGARRSSACHEQGLPPDMNIREVAADIKTYQRLNRAAGSGGSVAAAAGGLEVTADTPREEKQRQYGLKGPALQAQVGAWRPPWGTLSGCMPMSTYPWTHTSLPALWVALAALSGVCRALSACPCCAAAPAPPRCCTPCRPAPPCRQTWRRAWPPSASLTACAQSCWSARPACRVGGPRGRVLPPAELCWVLADADWCWPVQARGRGGWCVLVCSPCWRVLGAPKRAASSQEQGLDMYASCWAHRAHCRPG